IRVGNIPDKISKAFKLLWQHVELRSRSLASNKKADISQSYINWAQGEFVRQEYVQFIKPSLNRSWEAQVWYEIDSACTGIKKCGVRASAKRSTPTPLAY